MVKNFAKLSAHRHYVLDLYRITLRNINNQIHSVQYQSKLRSTLKHELKLNKSNPSGDYVRHSLRELDHFNTSVAERNFDELDRYLTKYSPEIIKGLDIAKSVLKKALVVNTQDANTSRNAFYLHKYIHSLQKSHTLPKIIDKKLKYDLLLPLALHEVAKTKLNRIRVRLLKGAPKVYVSSTKAGSKMISFIRSAFNKRKNQSKALTSIIVKERIKSQWRLDQIRFCQDWARWAYYEAQWEQIIETGTTLDTPLSQIFNLPKCNPSSLDKNSILHSWLNPIYNSIRKLDAKEAYRRKHFDAITLKLATDLKLINKYMDLSDRIHNDQVVRFKKVMHFLPSVIPFVPGRDLNSLLSKYKF